MLGGIQVVKVKESSIYLICLILLTLNSELVKLIYFKNCTNYIHVMNYVEAIADVGLIYIILRKGYSVKQLLGITCITILLFIGYIESGMSSYFRSVLLIVAAKDIPFNKIIRTIRYTVETVLIISIVIFIMDSTPSQYNGVAFGYNHPNVLGGVLLIICLLWLAEYSYKIKNISLIVCFVAIGILLLTRSRTPSLLLLLFPIIFYSLRKSERKVRYWTIVCFISEYAQLFLFAITYLSAAMLEKYIYIQKLDLLLENRIFLNYYALVNKGIKMFGQNVSLTQTGVYNNIRNLYNWSVTVDSTYMTSLIIMGLIPSAIFTVGYILSMKKCLKYRNYTLVTIGIMLAIYGFAETHVMNVYNNFIYLGILASMGNMNIRCQKLQS